MNVREAVVQRLREIIDKKDMSLYSLQKVSGMSEGTFLTLIYGDRKGVNLTTLITLVQSLGMSMKDFFDSELFDEGNLNID